MDYKKMNEEHQKQKKAIIFATAALWISMGAFFFIVWAWSDNPPSFKTWGTAVTAYGILYAIWIYFSGQGKTIGTVLLVLFVLFVFAHGIYELAKAGYIHVFLFRFR